MRAIVERDMGTEEDPYGAYVPNVSPVHGAEPLGLDWVDSPLNWGTHRLEWGSSLSSALPCYVQPRNERTVTDDGKFIAITVLNIWAPVDADLANEDIVVEVANLAGKVLYDGKHRVKALIRRETHLDGILEAYG